MKVPDGVRFELLLPGDVGSIKRWQSIDPVALKAVLKRPAGELRNGRLQRKDAVIEGQQRMLRKATMTASCSTLRTLPQLVYRLGVDGVPLGQCDQALLTMLDRPTHRR